MSEQPRDPIEEMSQRRVAGRDGSGFLAELRRLGLQNLLPWRIWLRDRPWDLVLVRWLLFFTLAPLLMTTIAYAFGPRFQSIALSYAIYFALMWGTVLYLFIRPERIGVVDVLRVGLFTLFSGLALLSFYQQLPWVQALYRAAHGDALVSRLIGFVLGVGVAEESVKLLPILWIFLYRKEPGTLREVTFLACVSGFAFGIAEAALYSVGYAVSLTRGQLGFEQFVVVQYARLITLPLLHAVFTGIAGYFVGLALTHAALSRALCAGGLVIAALLHGAYNTFSSGAVGLAVAIVTVLMFVGYVRNTDAIQAELSLADGGDASPAPGERAEGGVSDP